MERIEVKCSVFGMDIDGFDGCSGVLSGQDPGGEVSIVIEVRDEYFVAGVPRLCDCARECQGEGSHIRAERDGLRFSGL